MDRNAFEKLVIWKNDPERKPLILKGARQVGKTWLMEEFGKKQYKEYVSFNFDEEDEIKSIFEKNKNPHRIIELLGLVHGTKIIPGETLIIFDEIQECPNALNALKYFNEKASEYHIVCAGSMLGTLLAKPKSFPVGQVNLINIYPMSYDEFLAATDEPLYSYYTQIQKGHSIEEVFHNRLLEAYKLYLIIGGLPECVSSWARYKDPNRIKQIQDEAITIYENDFAKHNGNINSGRILLIFRSIVSQLAKDNRKFIYSCIKRGARAREYEDAIEWLVSAGMLNRVYNASKPEHPLKAFDQLNNFKLYVFDTGLLKYMAGIDNSAILITGNYQFMGALTENYILQQLKDQFEIEPRYYLNGQGEIDFLIQNGTEIIPAEVKSGEDKSSPSFKAYIKKHRPRIAVRYSKRGYATDGEITNIPLYLAGLTDKLI